MNKLEIWCFQVELSAAGKPIIGNNLTLSVGLAEANVSNVLKQALPQGINLIICLPSELVLLQSFNLDTKLSRDEKRSFVIAQISKSLKAKGKDVAYTWETVTNSTNSTQLVAAVNKKHLAPLINLISQHNCRCIRLESYQVTLAWLANKQTAQLKSKYWGIVEFHCNQLSLLFLQQRQVICQKSFYIGAEREDSVALVMQKIKQVLSLLRLNQLVTLFCTPALYDLLADNHTGEGCQFHPLVDLDSEEIVEMGFNERQIRYSAKALLTKSSELD